MEAAFLAHYGVDVLKPISLRRVWVLLQRLPPGAWPDGEHEASWTVEAYLLANVLDSVNDLAWLTAAVNSKKGSQPKRPKRTPRPGVKVKEKDAGLGSLMSAMKEVKR